MGSPAVVAVVAAEVVVVVVVVGDDDTPEVPDASGFEYFQMAHHGFVGVESQILLRKPSRMAISD